MPSPYNSAKPIAREFQDAVRKTNGAVQVNFSSMEGFIAAKVVAEGLRRGGFKTGREGLITGLESLGNLSLGGYNINFSRTEHVASSFVELSMLTGDGRVRT
jgi:ABC-type branched-subunit amino acid transport system substrate-binding protein